MEYEVQPCPPYDMEKVCLKLGADPMYEYDLELQTLSFAVRIKTGEKEEQWKKGMMKLEHKGTVAQPLVKVRYVGDELTATDEKWLQQHLTHRFQWGTNVLQTFYAELEGTSINSVLETLKGLPLVLDDGLFEGLITTIIHQQLNLRFAQQLVYSLAMDYGDQVQDGQKYFYLLPTPSQLAEVDIAELRTKKFSQRKAEYIIGVAQKVRNGELDLERLSALPNEAFIERLSQERGIGQWTAECILLNGLGRKDLFPAGDLGIRNAVKKIEGLEERPSIEACRAWVEPYQNWGSYVAIYLWEYLGNNRLKVDK
ncbi:DNA-3-methyladenine glycosylase family protein [Caldalkalibacillus salinus]|uniref:DNA-3-methyladenine glycosylase family protein n=1 Tax=Caldalkalibacillus salinus TaxID=2803787 RepID=UPI001924CA87|nr:DNA-3-methyladenine glycosylase [Caldalkalibacillus salinus]